MKIIHIISELNVGGAEMHLAKLLPHLSDTFDQEVCCLMGHGPVGKKLEASGIPVKYLNIGSRLNPFAILRLHKYLKKNRPDTVLTYLVYADLLGRLAGRAASVPRIISSQRSSLHGQTWLRYIDRSTRKLVDQYIVQTQSLRKTLQKLGYNTRTLTVIPNLVDIPSQPAKGDTKTIICVANLKKGKGHHILLKAFQRVHKKYPQWKLHLVGTGPLYKELKEQVKRNSLPVKFLGQEPNVPKLLRNSSIFILPTEAEGMSNAILEAMAAGLPCIVSNIPVNKEIVTDNKTGILIDTFDAQAYASAIETLIVNSSLRHKLGINARQHVETSHSAQVIANLWKAALKIK